MKDYTGILLVSDWDRTVTGPDGSIPPANTEAVLRFLRGGGRLSIATGHTRLSHGSRWNRLPTNAPHIIFNGAEIYDYAEQKVVWQGTLPDSADPLIRELYRDYPQLHFEIQCPEASYAFGEDMGLADIMRKMGVPVHQVQPEEVPRTRLQFAVAGTPKAPEKSATADLFRLSDAETDAVFGAIADRINAPGTGCTASRSLPFLVEAQATGCSKGETARRLREILNCERLVCCGDAMNDLSLLQAADEAYVAADGAPELLNRGFFVSAASGEGVLADVISRL